MEQLTSTQLSEWEAYDKLEPIGDWRADFRTSFLATIITNITKSLWGKKGTKMSSVDDFLFKWGEQDLEDTKEPKQQTMEEMKIAVKRIAAAFRKKDKPEPKQTAVPKRKRK